MSSSEEIRYARPRSWLMRLPHRIDNYISSYFISDDQDEDESVFLPMSVLVVVVLLLGVLVWVALPEPGRIDHNPEPGEQITFEIPGFWFNQVSFDFYSDINTTDASILVLPNTVPLVLSTKQLSQKDSITITRDFVYQSFHLEQDSYFTLNVNFETQIRYLIVRGVDAFQSIASWGYIIPDNLIYESGRVNSQSYQFSTPSKEVYYILIYKTGQYSKGDVEFNVLYKIGTPAYEHNLAQQITLNSTNNKRLMNLYESETYLCIIRTKWSHREWKNLRIKDDALTVSVITSARPGVKLSWWPLYTSIAMISMLATFIVLGSLYIFMAYLCFESNESNEERVPLLSSEDAEPLPLYRPQEPIAIPIRDIETLSETSVPSYKSEVSNTEVRHDTPPGYTEHDPNILDSSS